MRGYGEWKRLKEQMISEVGGGRGGGGGGAGAEPEVNA